MIDDETDHDQTDHAIFEAMILDRKIRALADPVRRRLLELLLPGSATAGDLAASVAAEFGISTSRGSQHLQVLARAELVSVTADGPLRNYRLVEGALNEVSRWLRLSSLERGADR